MRNAKPSTWAWISVHLIYPLLPVPLEGFIRCAVGNSTSNWVMNFDTFNAATLAISAGLMSVFVNQSLRTQEAALPDQAGETKTDGECVGDR
jgi:hypothetical protein